MKTGSKLDVRAGVRRRDDGVDAVGTAADVHDDVVDGVVVVEVVVEQQVAGLEVLSEHVDQRGPLGLGRARDLDARLGPGPLDESRNSRNRRPVSRHPRRRARRSGTRRQCTAARPCALLPTSTRVTVWEACSIASVTSLRGLLTADRRGGGDRRLFAGEVVVCARPRRPVRSRSR